MEHPVLLKQMIQADYGVGAGVSTDQPVRSFEASDVLGVLFRYLDYWAGGLVEEGADMGFYEKRIKEVASDRSVVSAEKEWRPEGIYGEKHRIRVKPVRMVRMVATRICCAWPV